MKKSASNGSTCTCKSQLLKKLRQFLNPSEATASSSDVKATPVAAAIITDKKVDKGTIIPSGANGKIVKHDVLEALTNPGRLPGKALFGREFERKK